MVLNSCSKSNATIYFANCIRKLWVLNGRNIIITGQYLRRDRPQAVMDLRKSFPSLLPSSSKTVNRLHYLPDGLRTFAFWSFPTLSIRTLRRTPVQSRNDSESLLCKHNRSKNTLTTKMIFYFLFFMVYAYFYTCFWRLPFFVTYTYTYLLVFICVI